MQSITDLSSLQRFHLFAQTIANQALIIMNTEGKIVEWSPGAEQLIGWGADEAVGKPISLIFTPEDQAAGAPVIELGRARKHGQAADIRWHQRKDGSRFYADGMVYALPGEKGEPIGFGKILKAAHSPFGRKISEPQNEQSAEREFLAAVLNSIEDGIVACNADGILTLFNRATREFHGLPEVPLPPDQWAEHYDLYEADGKTPLQKERVPLFRALSGEWVHRVEIVIAPKKGKRRVVLASGQPLIGEEGQRIGAVISMHDITSQKEVQAAREQYIEEQARRAEAEAGNKRIKESEELLQFALEAAGMVAWDWNLTTDFVHRTDVAKVINGLESGPLDEFMERVHPDDRKWVRARIDKARKRGAAYDFSYRILTEQGRIRWVNDKAKLRTDPVDGHLHFTGMLMDVTKRKQAEERLKLLDKLSQTTRTATTPAGVMKKTTQILGTYLKATRCAYADAENDNNHFTIREDWVAPGAVSSAGEYQLDQFGPRIASDMREGRMLVIRDLEKETDLGIGYQALAAMDIKAIICFPLAREGRLLAMMAVHQNMPRNWTQGEIGLVREAVERSWAHIERLHATEVLRKSQRHLSSLFEQTVAGLVETDRENCIVSSNSAFCQLIGRTQDELLGRHLTDFIHPDDVAASMEQLNNALAKVQSYEVERRYMRPDGTIVWARVALTPIRSLDGKTVEKILRVVLDITDRKRAEEQLRNEDQRKDEFLAMLAHELRNPLAPISAAAQLLQITTPDLAQVRQTSEVIARQVKHMTGLVDDLLDVSRVTRGLIKLEKTKLDVKRIVADAVEQVRPLLEARGHYLMVQTPPGDAFVLGDQKRLVQVLTNLLNNAAKYTPEGGSITLSMEVDGDHVKTIVADNGIGMSPEMIKHAFDLFAQAERTSDRSQGGLGIGLALVRSLVELHGGSVTAHSEGLGKGTQLIVCLPHFIDQDTVADTEKNLAILAAPTRLLKVMIVDDNSDAAQMLSMFVEALGHQALVEHSPLRALRRAKRERPDIYLLDIGLPEMDGIELARRLRDAPQTANAVLAAVTGYGQEQDRQRAIEAGFDYHFVKPIDVTKLDDLLRKIT